jgi:hypothetical protein
MPESRDTGPGSTSAWSSVVAFILASIIAFPTQRVEQRPLVGPASPVPLEYFGMHIHHADSPRHWPHVPFYGWRLWDSQVGWFKLEPERGRWKFATLDRYVELAAAHHVEILLPLGLTPAWASARPAEKSVYKQTGVAAEPRDIEDWRRYVRKVGERYKGVISHYEIWNEPNSPDFFSGSPETMIWLAREAYKILKEIDPNNVVVSPAATEKSGIRWLSRYLELGGADFADVIGFHFYVFPGPPEEIAERIRHVQLVLTNARVVGKPLWNTETGWHDRQFRPGEAEAYVARSLILTWASGVSRFYWYAWDNTDWATLRMWDPATQSASQAAAAFAMVQSWLIGNQLRSCTVSEGLWECTLSTAKGDSHILWNQTGSTKVPVERSWPDMRNMTTLSGTTTSIPESREIEVSMQPVLLSR